MSQPLNKQWGKFQNSDYFQIQHEIQLQTQNLLRQRQSYKLKNENTNTSSLNNYQSHSKITRQQNNNQNNEINRRKASQKLYQLIDMAKNDNNTFINNQEISKVISQNLNAHSQMSTGTQNNYLNPNNTYININNPILQAQHQNSSLQYGSRQQIISKLQISPQKKIQKSFLKQAISNNYKIQLDNNNNNINANDYLLQIIQQIQMKALSQIDKLKEQKIQLMRQLKKQIQANNQLQKQLNTKSRLTNNNNNGININVGSLQQQMLLRIKQQMDNIKRQNNYLHQIINQQRYIHNNNHNNHKQSQHYQLNQLKNKVTFYQNQLRKRDKLIQDLSIQKRYQDNPAQVGQLLQQGQQIRQNTIHLIHLKQGSNSNLFILSYKHVDFKYSQEQLLRRIEELQQLLYKEQEQKQSFLSDLLAFKQKYQQLQDQNKNLKRLSPNTFINNSKMPSFSPIYQKQSYDRMASLDDYERTLYRMQRNQY